MLKSKTIQFSDFSTLWYKKWSKLLNQQNEIFGIKYHNKGWQNAAILQASDENGILKPGNTAIGFGVGIERIPSALAKLGLIVTATDQNFINGKKAGWDNGQLAHKVNDLNMYKICKPNVFKDKVRYENCDMNNIGSMYDDKYDLVWSNCALGHLGSIDNGLAFIENSLRCLKPGGIAVHTTEINIINGEDTLDSGGTVIFRLNDLSNLFYNLRKKGYECKPLDLNFGNLKEDYDIKFYPYEKENLLKINVAGYLVSQIVLIIRKPKRKILAPHKINRSIENIVNKRKMKSFLLNNSKLREYIENHNNISLTGPKPKKRTYTIKMHRLEKKKIKLLFKNFGDTTYYDQYHKFNTNYPLVLVTDNIVNRDSIFASTEWYSKNRPTVVFESESSDSNWGAIKPDSEFYATIELKAPNKIGQYTEGFTLALEGLGIFEDANFVLNIKVF